MSGSIERPSSVQLLNLWDIAGDRPNERVEIIGCCDGQDFSILGRITSVAIENIDDPQATVEIESDVTILPSGCPRGLESSELWSVVQKDIVSVRQFELESDAQPALEQPAVSDAKPVLEQLVPAPVEKFIKPIFDNPSDFLGGC